MRINGPAREIVLKVVYYGPGMAGKTTNLTVVHDRVPSQAAGDMVMVDTHSERTLRFDLLAVDAAPVRGHKVRFEFYTVPGQSYYAATRRAVLAGADGVVFVADSRREALDENIEAMNEMLNNLRHHGLPEDLPVVVQYNKQDLPTALKREQLEPLMNVRGWPSQAGIAIDGQGVMETMQAITALIIRRAEASNQIPDLSSSPPAIDPGRPPASWLISCYRCQAMLEVPDAKIGALYACGICASPLEVTDPERGLTRPPVAQGTAVVGNRAATATQDESAYGLQTVAETGGVALGRESAATQSSGNAPAGTPFEIPGYDVVAPLDDSLLGRRSRVRERASGRNLRALSINSALFRQPGYRENLEPYVRLASQVKHPYILPLAALTATKEAAVLFSADPPDYEPLGHILARRRALAPPHAMGIVRQVALALEEAARHGVVHGWLRPDVVLVSPDGNVLVDEFACPKNHRFLIRELSGASAATEYYLAPEHIGDENRSDIRSDMFMLGGLLFRMLTGEGLVTGYNAHEALHKVVANGARSLRSVQAGVSRDLDLFYQSLVATERKDRYQSYRELIDTLDKFGGGAKRQTLRLTQNVQAPGTGGIRRPGTGPMRRPGGTGQLRRVGTSELPRVGTASIQRQQPRSGEHQTGSVRKREPQGSGALIPIMVVLALVLGAGIAYVMLNPTLGRSNPPPPVPLEPATAHPPAPAPADTTPKGEQPQRHLPKSSYLDKPAPTVTQTPPATVPSPLESPAGTPPPAPTPVNPNNDPNLRIGVVLRIAELERSQHFKEAMEASEEMPSAEEKQAKILNVIATHDRAKADVEARITASRSMVEIDAMLKPAATVWGLPGDDDWAKAQRANAAARLGGGPATAPLAQLPVPVPAPSPGTQPPTPAPAPAGGMSIEKVTAIDGQISIALVANTPTLALQTASPLDAAAAETAAIKRKIAIWTKRGDILGRVITERSPILRIPHPTTNEMWDITAASSGGLSVSSAAGSKTDLTWNQVTIKDLARVCTEITVNPMAKSEEHVLSTVMLLLAGETVLARVQIQKGKAVLEPDAAADLELLVGLQRRRDALELVTRADEAVRTGNAKLLAELVEQIKKLDKSLQPLVAVALTRLEGELKGGVTPVPGAGNPVPNANKDHLSFATPNDLNAFTQRSGAWQSGNGSLSNSASGANQDCRLVRSDLKDARALHIIFQPLNQKGAMVVDFRGVRLVIEFGASTYQAISKEETLKPKPFSFLPKAGNSLFFELKQPNNFVSIDVNNGADTMGLKGGEVMNDSLSLTLDTGALVSIQEVQIMRGSPASQPRDKAGDLRKLGIDPLGGAYLDAPLIVLPTGGNNPSGFAMPLKDNVSGATFEAKGTGNLRIQLGNPNDRSGQWIDVPVGVVATAYKVSWTANSLVVSDGVGNPVGTVALMGGHSHFMIYALQEATIMSTPRLIYQ
jgi:mutual gliding-motility protein MglA